MKEIKIEYLELFDWWRILMPNCIAVFVRDFYFPKYLTGVLVGLNDFKPSPSLLDVDEAVWMGEHTVCNVYKSFIENYDEFEKSYELWLQKRGDVKRE